MKKLLTLVLVMLTVLLSAVSCAPETINNDDEQLNTEIQGVDRGVQRPGTQGK